MLKVAGAVTLHTHPVSTVQVSLQPSPGAVLPSSQPSVPVLMSSPQVATQAWPAVGQV